MEREFAFLCDYAEAEQKLHAIGIGWNTINAPALPATHPMMSVVAKLRGTIAENGTKNIELRLIDADGADVIPSLKHQLPFEVKPPHLEGYLQIVLNMGGVPLKKYGRYAVHVVVEGHEMATLSFSVVAPPTTT